MKRSHLFALALGALILSLLLCSLVITLSNDQELAAFSKPLFSCALPPKTAKVVEVAYRIGGITTMNYKAYLLVRSDLTETELQQYYQANVFSLAEIKRKSNLSHNVIENRNGIVRSVLEDMDSALVKNLYDDNTEYRSYYMVGMHFQKKGSLFDLRN